MQACLVKALDHQRGIEFLEQKKKGFIYICTYTSILSYQSFKCATSMFIISKGYVYNTRDLKQRERWRCKNNQLWFCLRKKPRINSVRVNFVYDRSKLFSIQRTCYQWLNVKPNPLGSQFTSWNVFSDVQCCGFCCFKFQTIHHDLCFW